MESNNFDQIARDTDLGTALILTGKPPEGFSWDEFWDGAGFNLLMNIIRASERFASVCDTSAFLQAAYACIEELEMPFNNWLQLSDEFVVGASVRAIAKSKMLEMARIKSLPFCAWMEILSLANDDVSASNALWNMRVAAVDSGELEDLYLYAMHNDLRGLASETFRRLLSIAMSTASLKQLMRILDILPEDDTANKGIVFAEIKRLIS